MTGKKYHPLRGFDTIAGYYVIRFFIISHCKILSKILFLRWGSIEKVCMPVN
jgi:hypothetical protein